MKKRSPIEFLTSPRQFQQVQRIANMLAHSSFLPKHLKATDKETTVANCFRVCQQALTWGFNPFAVADETFFIGNRLGYSGKLIAAVINTSGALERNLQISYVNEDKDLTIIVRGTLKGEAKPRDAALSLSQAKTANQMWSTDPRQKLWYSGAVRWARRHAPELIFGVLTEEDLEFIADPDALEASVVEPDTEAIEEPQTQEALPPSKEPEFTLEPAQEPQKAAQKAASKKTAPKKKAAKKAAGTPGADPVGAFIVQLGKCKTLGDLDAVLTSFEADYAGDEEKLEAAINAYEAAKFELTAD